MSVVRQLEATGEVLSSAVRAALVALEERVRVLESLEEIVARQQERIRDLGVRLGLDSTNSSKPPSSDPPGKRRRGKRSTRSH